MQNFDDQLWKHAVTIRLIGISRAIYMLCFAIGWLALGFIFKSYFDAAPEVAALSICGMGLVTYLNEGSSLKLMQGLYDKRAQNIED